MEKRRTHVEFVLTSEFTEEKFKKYFRLPRFEFEDVCSLIESDIQYVQLEPLCTKSQTLVLAGAGMCGD